MVQTSDPKVALSDKALYQDLWGDAHMTEVIVYLRRAKDLALPGEWKALLPTSLPPV